MPPLPNNSPRRRSGFRPLVKTALAAVIASAPFTVFSQSPPGTEGGSGQDTPEDHCAELRYADMSGFQEGPAQISSARVTQRSDDMPAYCEVDGYVWRNVRFRITFPLTSWNEKLVFSGGGGQGGTLPRQPPSPSSNDYNWLRKGYAVAHHDGGHFSTVSDTKWAANNADALLDFGVRGVHVATLAAKEVLEIFHKKSPQASYFYGCSNSGREAMNLAQRFPQDYDGIVAGSPSMNANELMGNMLFMAELLRDQSRQGFDLKAATVLHNASLQQCDEIDGQRDGIIDDPRSCRVDFAPITCKRGQRYDCLTAHQADIAQKIYAGPRKPDGTQIVPSSAYPGSELQWIEFLTPRWVINYAKEYFQYEAIYPAPGNQFNPISSDLSEYMLRTGVSDLFISATNPDIRKFKARGGKLLSFYGWNDPVGGARTIMDYYNTVENVMTGSEQTRDFFRLFMVPGMNHCRGGDGVSVFDFIEIMDQWVQHGNAPDHITGHHPGPDGKPMFTRSIPAYTSQRADQ